MASSRRYPPVALYGACLGCASLERVSRQGTVTARMPAARSLAVHPEDAPTPTEAVVLAAVEHLLDAHLPEGGRAHDARLNRHVQRRLRERVRRARGRQRCVRQDLVDGLQLCMPGRLWVGPLSDGTRGSGAREHTLRSSLVRLRARAMILPSLTNTQPTGTSVAARASSACAMAQPRCTEQSRSSHHIHRLHHPVEMFVICAGVLHRWNLNNSICSPPVQ